MRFLERLFRMEEMSGGGMCPVYLRRWTLLKLGDYAVMLHRFLGDDWSRDLHDHPKRFISIGLWGGYIEETPASLADGRWEVATDTDGAMVRVRWSQPAADGAHLYVRHYPNTSWGRMACDTHVEDFERRGVSPTEWGWRPGVTRRAYRAPWVRTFPADYVHRIVLDGGRGAWTLCIVLKATRKWGFWTRQGWVFWRDYVRSDEARARRSCQ